MDLIEVILAAGLVVLWFRTGGLKHRLAQAENDLLALSERLAAAEAELNWRNFPDVSTPAVPDAVPGWETAALAASQPAEAAEPAAAMAAAEPPATADWLAEPTLPAEPAGPSLVRQLLLKLGLAPSDEGGGFSRSAIEAWLEGRMLAAIGGLALLLGAVFFLSLAFSRGWITEPMRVLIGLIAGTGLLVLGELALSKLRGILGHVLVAVGLAVISLALLAATRLYGLVPVEWGLVAALLASVATAAIAIRHDSQVIAGFGLVAVLAAPPVLGASPTLVTLVFVAITLVGTTGVALFRTWIWLPPLAFLLAAPQLASYVAGDAPTAEALIAIAAFWLVNTVAAGGEEFRHATDRLRTATVTLLLASAAFTLWAGFAVLAGPEAQWRGSFLTLAAAAHLGLGLFFLRRDGDRHPFGLVVAATGVAALTMAVPIQFGGPPVPIAWAAEAVALAWVAVMRRHPYSAGVAALLGVLALGHLVSIEYPLGSIGAGFDHAWPFVSPEGLTFAFIAGALVVAGIAVPIAWVRGLLTVIGGLLVLYVAPFELSGTGLVAAWAALGAIATVLEVRIVREHVARDFVERRVPSLALPRWLEPSAEAVVAALSRLVRPGFVAVAALGSVASLGHLVAFDFPIGRIGAGSLSTVPYVGMEGLSLAVGLAALAAVGWLVADRSVRLAATGIGLLLLVYSIRFEIEPPNVMIAWGLLGVTSVAVARRVVVIDAIPAPNEARIQAFADRLPFGAAALALLFLVVQAYSYADFGQFARHIVGDLAPATAPFLDVRSFAFAILAATAVAGGWTWRGTTALLAGGVGAGLVVAWLLPFEIRTGYAVAGWAALALAGAAVARRVPEAPRLVGFPSVLLAGFGALVTLGVVAPPDRLVVDASTVVVGWPILTDATVALGALALAAGIGAYLHRVDPLSRPAFIAAGITAVYMLSVGLVDIFQLDVGARPLEELQKESQVGLSVLWSVLGGIGFAAGLRTRRPLIRLAGLALLGLATVKVFLVDLAALDVAYRVLSLVALGILLLGSAFIYSRMQHPHPPTTPKPA